MRMLRCGVGACRVAAWAGVLALAAGATRGQFVWRPQGPGPALGAQVEGMQAQGSPASGACRVVLPHPTDPDVCYAGTVNGGVWKTSNARALHPDWEPLTDTQRSSSIGDLVADPTDPTFNTLVAGYGRFSALASAGATRLGLIRTTDGGATWTSVGEAFFTNFNIASVAARGATLVVGVNLITGETVGTPGLYRSTDGGATWTLISGGAGTGLPPGPVITVAGDPGAANRLYAGVLSTNVGVYRSDDAGATWVSITAGIIDLNTITTNNIKISVHDTPGANVVYAMFCNNGRAAGCFRSTDLGASWTNLGLPFTIENDVSRGLHPGSQGAIHFAIAADPQVPTLLYAGGDRQPDADGMGTFPNSIGANDYSGRIFRCDATQPAGSRWTPLTNNFTANNSSPHADSRSMAFDATGDLLHGDNGGVYRRTLPRTSGGVWTAVTGDMAVIESHSAGYDNLSNVCVAGTQDNGTCVQRTLDDPAWDSVQGGDAGDVLIDNLSSSTMSIRYGSTQNLTSLLRSRYHASGELFKQDEPALIDTATGGSVFNVVNPQLLSPIVLNTVNPERLVFVLNLTVWESLDRGETVTKISTPSGTPNNAVAGGMLGGASNPEVLYIVSNSGVRLRTTPGGTPAALTAYPGGAARTVAIDPDHWPTVVVGNSAQPARVYLSGNAGASWTDISGNLNDLDIRALVIAPVPEQGGSVKRIIAAARQGIVSTPLAAPGNWTRLGTVLPPAQCFDVRYDPVDNVLVAATLGRGVWLTTLSLPACRVEYNGDGTVNPDDLGDYITDYHTDPAIPGPGGYASVCPGNPPPYDAGYKANFTADNSAQCIPPFPDNLGDYITAYFAGC